MENKWPKNKWLKAGIVLSAVGSVMILLILVIGLALSGDSSNDGDNGTIDSDPKAYQVGYAVMGTTKADIIMSNEYGETIYLLDTAVGSNWDDAWEDP